MSETNTTLPEGAYPIEGLLWYGGEWKYGHGKSIAIVTSLSAILSVIFSSLLVAMLLKSKDKLSTAYHRLLMGMAVGDILFSLPHAFFHALMPKDMNWLIWNARGNQTTCTIDGFVVRVGATLSLFYICSLILYYLAKVRYNKTEMYIRTKLERFLHGVPIVAALAQGIIGLVNENYNTTGAGVCTLAPVYNPGHCVGYNDGVIREGFEIPCGRGKQEALYQWFSFVVFMVPPVVIIVSFGMIYGAVRQQEKRIGRYGVGSVNVRATQRESTETNPAFGESGSGTSRSTFHRMKSSIGSSFASVRDSVRTSVLRGRESVSNDSSSSNSRAVMYRAFAYIMAYFISWLWAICGEIMLLAEHDVPLAYNYVWTILVPMQGMFNFLVYIHPKVKKVKEEGNISWPRAFARAILTGLGHEGMVLCCKLCTKRNPDEKNDTETTGGINGMANTSVPTNPSTASRRGTDRLKSFAEEEEEEAEIGVLEDGGTV